MPRPDIRSLGLIGFGAFGRLAAVHIAPHLALTVTDTARAPDTLLPPGARAGTLADAAACNAVLLAVPVCEMGNVIAGIAPHLRPGALVADTGSVKLATADRMRRLPAHVELAGTHPLFGPQSARGGIAGLKIAVLPAARPRPSAAGRLPEAPAWAAGDPDHPQGA